MSSKGALPPPTPIGVPLANRCLSHPDTPLWRAAVRGVLALMTYKYYWDLSGLNDEQIDDFMLVARGIYYSLEDNCTGGNVDCDEVIDCIIDNQNNPALAAAIGNAWGLSEQASAVQRALGEAKAIALQSVVPAAGLDCDRVLYNMARVITEQLVKDVVDFLQQIEVQSNILELGAALSALVTAGTIGGIIDIIVGLQDNILEVFEAEVTDEFVDGIACEIYQQYAGQCELSVDDILEYFRLKLGNPTWQEIGASIASLAGFMLAGNPLLSRALMATALLMAKLGAIRVSSPLGDIQVSPGAMMRYNGLLRIAAQSESIIPQDCAPEQIVVRLRGNRYRVNNGAWIDITWDTFGVPVSIDALFPVVIDIEDNQSQGYIVFGECGNLAAPRMLLSAEVEALRYDATCNYEPMLPGEQLPGRRLDFNYNTGNIASVTIHGIA